MTQSKSNEEPEQPFDLEDLAVGCRRCGWSGPYRDLYDEGKHPQCAKRLRALLLQGVFHNDPDHCTDCRVELAGRVFYGAGDGRGQRFRCESCHKKSTA